MGGRLLAVWNRLPVIVRALAVAYVAQTIGSTLGVLPLVGNTKFLRDLPWALPATLLLMWAFWWYASGHGYPTATRAYRAAMTRDKTLSARSWRAVLPAIFAALVATCCLRLALPSIVEIAPPRLPIDPSAYPAMTTIGLALALAASSGIVEEIAFRGYLQKSLEEAYGIVPALILTGTAFWYAHAHKISISHLPFHLIISVLLGSATFLTRSLIPAIIGHVLGDALLLPAYAFHQPRIAWSLLIARPVWEAQSSGAFADRLTAILGAIRPDFLLAPASHALAVTVWVQFASLIAAVFALRRLARVVATST
jgi:membrane protease YdiL (CAAX protease family)